MRLHLLPARCLLALLPMAFAGEAAPSGGPYGPIAEVYQVPSTGHVYYVAPDGKAKTAGTLKAPLSLEAAVAKAVSGDAVILRGGLYRTGNIAFNQRITFQPYAGEHPVLKGTEVATKWEKAGDKVWKTSWTKLFPAHPLPWWNRKNEEAKTPLHRFNNDMVFVDGQFLQSAGSVAELDGRNYYIDYDKHEVYIGSDPAGHVVEITAHDGALIRTTKPVNGKKPDHLGPIIKGLTFTQYAWRALEVEGKKQFGPNDEPTDEPIGLSDPSTYGKEVTDTRLENVTITWCSRVAGYFRGDRLVIKNSLVSDTGTEGIYVIGSSDVLLEKNIVRRNNIEHLTGYYPGAVKIFNQSHRVTIRDNLILENPNSNGVWYDVGNRDGVFVNNYVEGALVGFFFEISRGATVAGNVFAHNGRGSWFLNSDNARIYNNTYIDNPAAFERNERVATGDVFAWHSTTGPAFDKREGHIFVNNLVTASESYREPLLRVEQPASLCSKLTNPAVKEVDGNVYVRPAEAEGPLALIAPAEGCTAKPATVDGLQKLGLEAKGRQIDAVARDALKSPDFDRFEPQKPIPAAVPLPENVRKLLGWSEAEANTVGAYPAK